MKFLKIRDVKSPERGTKLSSWIDFFVPNRVDSMREEITFTAKNYCAQDGMREDFIEDNCIRLNPWMWVLIPSWLRVILPKWWDTYTYEMVLYNKSWIAVKQNLLVWAQVIDNDYRWEFNIHLINTWNWTVFIEWWQKIAQWIIRRVELFSPIEISEQEFNKDSDTERGEWWFWSTWTK